MTRITTSSLIDVVTAIEIESPSVLRFAGEEVEVVEALPGAGAHATPPFPVPSRPREVPESVRAGVESLLHELYLQAYTFPFDGVRRRSPAPEAPDADFARLLAEANSTRERWEDGWRLDGVEPGGRVLARHAGGGVRGLRAGEYRPASAAGVAPGAPIHAFLAKGSLDLQPGFYVVFGESVADDSAGYAGAVRLYFNVAAAGAAPLVQAVTGHLNRFQVPFSFKVLSQPGYFASRADAAVLFLHRRYFHVAAELVAGLPALLGPHLGRETPLFSKCLAPGVGVAEDPGTGDSFGRSRCRLLSEAVWSAWLEGETTPEARLRHIERRFEEAGLALDAPHLNAGSLDRYHLPDSRRPQATGGP